jgi:ATP-dependent HslUV protease ATP-binding subunit HslU
MKWELAAEEKLMELLMQQPATEDAMSSVDVAAPTQVIEPAETGAPDDVALSKTESGAPSVVPPREVSKKSEAENARERERLLMQFREGKLDDRMVELETRERAQPQIEVMTNQPDDIDTNGVKEMLAGIFGARTRKRSMKVVDAFDYLTQEEEGRLLDMEQVVRVAVERVEDSGIVFLDEIDKIAGREGGHGPDISREGVQRDILPIVEGTTVSTKYGMVATNHILFVAAGAFHVSKPSDLIPELQGRFPIRVELLPLTVHDFLRILTEPRASLTKQAIALLETEGLKLEFAPEALEEMARFAFEVNETTENIGARRLHTILEKVLDEISFAAPDMVKAAASGEGVFDGEKVPSLVDRQVNKANGETVTERILIVDRAYVEKQVAGIVKNQDLSRYIL